ncbi:MAG: DUF1559 domain-containing protein [Planctomycetota bacterium]
MVVLTTTRLFNQRVRKRGFTLVELLVVVSIMAILASLSLPALNKARESARSIQCSSNLRNFGIAMIDRSLSGPDGTFCTGATDLVRDGVPSEIGWVSDMAKSGSVPGEMICPSNQARVNRTIEQLATLPVADFNQTCVDRLGELPYTNELGEVVANECRTIANSGTPLAPGSIARLQVIQRKILDSGLYTNYAASWFLVRGGLRLNGTGNVNPISATCPIDARGRNITAGPMTESQVQASPASRSTIPMLFDTIPTGRLSLGFGTLEQSEPYVTSVIGGPIGRSVRIDTDGDGAADTTSTYFMRLPVFPAGTDRSGPDGWLKQWTVDTRQDYRGIDPLHAGVANILMADGAVVRVADANSDGFLNNGFDGADAIGWPGTADNQVFWKSSVEELGKTKLASFFSLSSQGPSQ